MAEHTEQDWVQRATRGEPAAVGGVLNRWSILREGVWVASVGIYLEPWASVRSGQPIELTAGTPFPSLKQPNSRSL